MARSVSNYRRCESMILTFINKTLQIIVAIRYANHGNRITTTWISIYAQRWHFAFGQPFTSSINILFRKGERERKKIENLIIAYSLA